ncbi:MAG: peptidoglycan recognition protein family protein [Oscillospiraceae bacterium]
MPLLPIQKMIIPTFPQEPMTGIKGIAIHNTYSTASAYQEALRVQNPNAYNNGCTTFWVDDIESWQTIPDGITGWHLGVYSENQRYIGIEVCKSRSDEATYLKALDNALELATYLCKVYGLNENNIVHHNQFYATACPHRSIEIFGGIDQALFKHREIVRNKLNGATPTPTPEEKRGDRMKPTLPFISTLCEVNADSNFFYVNDTDNPRTDIPMLKAGEQVVVHHVFIQDAKRPAVWHGLCYRPNTPDAVALVRLEEGDRKYYKVLGEYLPPVPVQPDLKVNTLDKPIKGVLITELTKRILSKDKKKVEQTDIKYPKGSILEYQYYVDFNNIRYIFKDKECQVGVSLAPLPVAEDKKNVIDLKASI